MKYYHFRQNNSGGEFDVTPTLNVNVIIKAATAIEANTKLEELGGYFDGVSEGLDCECCGDRWYRVSENDVSETPQCYGHDATTMSDCIIHE